MDSPEKNKTAELSARRRFMKEGLAAMAGVLLFGDAAMGRMLEVDWQASPTPEETNKPNTIGGKGDIVHDLAKPFLDERYEFDIKFLKADAAHGLLTFKKTGRNQYTASAEATIAGLIGQVAPYRKIVMTSVMMVRTREGKSRFLTTLHYRKSIKTDGSYENRHEFKYLGHKWYHYKYKNGQRTSKRVRTIPKDRFYDDPINLMYNFRAQVYGPVKPGLRQTIPTMPMYRTVEVSGLSATKSAESVDVHAVPDGEMNAEDKRWLADLGADLLFTVKLDPVVYRIESGMAKFATDKNMRPCGAKIDRAWVFGDARAEIRK